MKLLFINEISDIDFFKKRIIYFSDDVYFTSFNLNIISYLSENSFNYFNLTEDFNAFLNQDFNHKSKYRSKDFNFLFSKGSHSDFDNDLELVYNLIYKGEFIVEKILNFKFTEVFIRSIKSKTLLRSGPNPFELYANNFVLEIIKLNLIEKKVKISFSLNWKLIIKLHFNSFKLFLSDLKKLKFSLENSLSHNQVLIIDSLIYQSEIDEIKKNNPSSKVVSPFSFFYFNYPWIFLMFLLNWNINKKIILNNLHFSEIKYKNKLINQFKHIYFEYIKSLYFFNSVIKKYPKLNSVFFGHDAFTFEMNLSRLFVDRNINVYSYIHYGVSNKSGLANISNSYSHKLIWNIETLKYVPKDKFKFFTINPTLRYSSFKYNYENLNLDLINHRKILLLSALPNLSLYNFNIDYLNYSRDFILFIESLLKNDIKIDIKNHPSFDDYDFYYRISNLYSNVSVLNKKDKNYRLFPNYNIVVIFNYFTTAAIEAIVSGCLVICFFSKKQVYELSDSNFFSEYNLFFENHELLVSFILTLNNTDYLYHKNRQMIFYNKFVGNL